MANVKSGGGRDTVHRGRPMATIPPFLIRASSVIRHFDDFVSIRR